MMATPSTPSADSRRPENFFSPPVSGAKTEKKVSPEPVTVRKKDYSGYYYYKVFEKKGEEAIDDEVNKKNCNNIFRSVGIGTLNFKKSMMALETHAMKMKESKDTNSFHN